MSSSNSNIHVARINNSSVVVNGNRYAALCLYPYKDCNVHVELDDLATKAFVRSLDDEFLGEAVLVERGVAA